MTKKTKSHTSFRPLRSLSPWKRNYNRGDVDAIQDSIERFGFNAALRVWKDEVIVAGNHTYAALCRLRDASGDAPAGEAVRICGDDWEVLCIDLSHLSLREAEAFAIADNRVAALATPDQDALADLLNDLGSDPTLLEAIGYTPDEIDVILARLDAPDVEFPEYDESAAADVEYLECPECHHRWPK